jgi:hypothetical protein
MPSTTRDTAIFEIQFRITTYNKIGEKEPIPSKYIQVIFALQRIGGNWLVDHIEKGLQQNCNFHFVKLRKAKPP